MTSKKKSVSRKRKNTRSRARSARPRSTRLKRFLTGFVAAATVSFGIASCVLNPQYRPEFDFVEYLPEVDVTRYLSGFDLSTVLARVRVQRYDEPIPPALREQAYTRTRFDDCLQFFPYQRPPVVPIGPELRELCFDAFAILHSGQRKTPVFVAERLNRTMLVQARAVARVDQFYAEGRLPHAERAQLDDYRGLGYSRGHMAAAANMPTPRAMAQSFSLANIVPQNQRQNAGPWNTIEQDTRKYVMRAKGDVFVFSGPVYDLQPIRLGEGRVAVPAQVFKLVHDVTTGRSWVHWQNNADDARVGPPISYEEFVRRTGLHLLPPP